MNNARMRQVNGMGIRPLPENTEYVEAGAVTFGVEFRFLTYEVATAVYKGNQEKLDMLADMKRRGVALNDTGVSIHAFGNDGDELAEYLRFDCFDHDPHYHYMLDSRELYFRIEFDDEARRDTVAWTLDALGARLPEMLAEAGVPELAKRVEPDKVEAAIPKVALAVERANERLSRAIAAG